MESVTYERLKSFGMYENIRIGITGTIQEGESADKVLADLKAWVDEKIAEEISKPEIEFASIRLGILRAEEKRVRAELDSLKDQLVKAKAILDAFVQKELPKTVEELKKEQFYDPFSPENEPDLGEEEDEEDE